MLGNGNDINVFIARNAVGYTTSASLSIQNALMEVTTKPTDGWKEHITAVKGGSVSFSGLVTADFSSVNSLEESLREGSIVEFTFGVDLEYQLGGDGYISDLSFTGGTDDTMSFDGTIQLSAEIATRLSTEIVSLQINGTDVTINGVALMVAVRI